MIYKEMRMTCKHENVTGVMFINDNGRTSGTSCILCVHAFGGYPYPIDNDRYALHSAAVTVLVLTGPSIRGSQSMPTG